MGALPSTFSYSGSRLPSSAIFSSNLDDERSDDEEDHAEPAPKGKCE
jgi:hypothetical protein